MVAICERSPHSAKNVNVKDCSNIRPKIPCKNAPSIRKQLIFYCIFFCLFLEFRQNNATYNIEMEQQAKKARYSPETPEVSEGVQKLDDSSSSAVDDVIIVKCDEGTHEAPRECDNVFDRKMKHISLVDYLPSLYSFDVNNARALDFFYLMMDESIFVTFTTKTNEYAELCQTLSGEKDLRWCDLSLEELKAYFGLTIIMGVTPAHLYSDYWSSDPFLRNRGFQQVMSLNR